MMTMMMMRCDALFCLLALDSFLNSLPFLLPVHLAIRPHNVTAPKAGAKIAYALQNKPHRFTLLVCAIDSGEEKKEEKRKKRTDPVCQQISMSPLKRMQSSIFLYPCCVT
jgi:hypothetical protein